MMDLSTATTEEIIAELADRYDHIIVAGIKEMTTRESTGGQPVDPLLYRLCRWKGNSDTCCGLAARVQFTVMRHDESGSRPVSDEEDVQ